MITINVFGQYVEVVTPELVYSYRRGEVTVLADKDYVWVTLSERLKGAAMSDPYSGLRFQLSQVSNLQADTNKNLYRKIRSIFAKTEPTLGAFSDDLTSEMQPIIQAKATYGLRTKMETFTGTSGSTTAAQNLFTVQSGTSVGGYGVIRTRRPAVYHAGQGMRGRFTALFTLNPPVNSFQGAGLFNATDGLFFGSFGTEFGIIHEYDGRLEIQDLQVTTPASGTENATITIDGVAYTVPLTSGTVQKNAYEIFDYLNTNATEWTFEYTNDTVTMMSQSDGDKTGTFSFTSSSAVATFTEVQAGVPKTRDFIPQNEWNEFPADSLEWDKGNIFQVIYPYLGFGNIKFQLWDNNINGFQTVHIIYRNNLFAGTNTGIPSFKIGWFAASLGSTTNLTVSGASCAIFSEGLSRITEEPRGSSNTGSIGTDFRNILTLRNRNTFNGRQNLSEVLPKQITAGCDSTKQAVFTILENADLGEAVFQYIDKDESTTTICKDLVPFTGGRELGAFIVGPAGTQFFDMSKLDYLLLPNNQITIAARVSSGASSDISCGLSWQEDL